MPRIDFNKPVQPQLKKLSGSDIIMLSMNMKHLAKSDMKDEDYNELVNELNRRGFKNECIRS